MSAAPVNVTTLNPDGSTVTVQPVPGYGVTPRGTGTDNSWVEARPYTKMSGVKINPSGNKPGGKSAW